MILDLKNIDDLINKSWQFNQGDYELIQEGIKLANKSLVSRSDYVDKKDLMVTDFLCTEFMVDCTIKDKFSEEPLFVVNWKKWSL
jgi:hypothetical protein